MRVVQLVAGFAVVIVGAVGMWYFVRTGMGAAAPDRKAWRSLLLALLTLATST